MIVQMSHHLAFGFRYKAQAPFVTGQSGTGANGDRAEIPNWIQQAGVGAQFIGPSPAPAQMIVFLSGRLLLPLFMMPRPPRRSTAGLGWGAVAVSATTATGSGTGTCSTNVAEA